MAPPEAVYDREDAVGEPTAERVRRRHRCESDLTRGHRDSPPRSRMGVGKDSLWTSPTDPGTDVIVPPIKRPGVGSDRSSDRPRPGCLSGPILATRVTRD